MMIDANESKHPTIAPMRPDEEGNPDNVVIGQMTGLQDSSDSIRVETGAGDDLLQVTGLLCNS